MIFLLFKCYLNDVLVCLELGFFFKNCFLGFYFMINIILFCFFCGVLILVLLVSQLIVLVVMVQMLQQVGICGSIVLVGKDQLVVKINKGVEQNVVFDKDICVVVILIVDINDIKFGSYIGVVGILQLDGFQKVFEVYVFLFVMVGIGDGYCLFDLVFNSIMINGIVGDVVVSQGCIFILKYKGGEKKIVVFEDVFVVSIEVGDCLFLVVGVKVVVCVCKNVDGSLIVNSVSVGKNGIILLM